MTVCIKCQKPVDQHRTVADSVGRLVPVCDPRIPAPSNKETALAHIRAIRAALEKTGDNK